VDTAKMRYVGFWARVGAALIDTILVCVIIFPLLHVVYGPEYWTTAALLRGPADFLISWVLPIIAVLIFWFTRQATPGKMAISAKIVDADTGEKPSTGQFIGRYFAYFVATIPFGIGLLWVAFDPRKQGWHDKLAGTVVIERD
jgi:uncharacterized RDD family membrane protein YckC